MPDQGHWLTQVLRLTLFTTAPLPNNENLWATIAGQPPETEQYQAREFTRLQYGVLGGAALTVQSNPARTDILMGVPAASTELHFGPFETTAETFKELVSPWLT